jgi:hypothetical protein
MIKGVHTMFHTSQAEALRAFIRDKLCFPFTDVGRAGGQPSGTHYPSFYCDDIEKTVADLRARGVEFADGISDVGYGLATHFRVPGDFELELYQPSYRK